MNVMKWCGRIKEVDVVRFQFLGRVASLTVDVITVYRLRSKKISFFKFWQGGCVMEQLGIENVEFPYYVSLWRKNMKSVTWELNKEDTGVKQ